MTLPPGDQVAAALSADGNPVADIVIEPDPDRLARAAAEALVARLAAAQAVHGTASVVLTGGGTGIAVLEQVARLAAEPVREEVDWRAVDVWWGDERFVPADDDERNEKGARRALLDRVDVDPARVHPMAPSDGPYATVEDAAAAYAEELAAAAPEGAAVPRFDVLLLGMGPEGHVASIFPGSPASTDERPAFAVHECPKPPPTRISLGFSAITTAEEVWLLVTGQGKAEAVARALAGEQRTELPAAGARGTRATRWVLDEAAAGLLPRGDD